MVKLTEVEDEHFNKEKPTPSKNDILLASEDEDDDFTDTGEYPSCQLRVSMVYCGAVGYGPVSSRICGQDWRKAHRAVCSQIKDISHQSMNNFHCENLD